MPVSEQHRFDDSPSFGSLKAFELIGRLGGIRKAAIALGVDHAVISRHLKSLEEWAGIPLVDRRRGENGKLTDRGARYHSRISAALYEINDACADLRQRWENGILRVWSSQALSYQWLMPRFQEFEGLHENLEVDWRIIDDDYSIAQAETSVRIEFLCDGSSYGPEGSLRTQEIYRPAMVPVVSPSFLTHARELRDVSEIRQFRLLHEDTGDNWRRWLSNYDVMVSQVLRGSRLSHAHLTIDAAKRGQGIALVPDLLVADSITEGSLVELNVAGRPLPRTSLGAFMLTARSDQWGSPAISKLRVWLGDAMRRTCN